VPEWIEEHKQFFKHTSRNGARPGVHAAILWVLIRLIHETKSHPCQMRGLAGASNGRSLRTPYPPYMRAPAFAPAADVARRRQRARRGCRRSAPVCRILLRLRMRGQLLPVADVAGAHVRGGKQARRHRCQPPRAAAPPAEGGGPRGRHPLYRPYLCIHPIRFDPIYILEPFYLDLLSMPVQTIGLGLECAVSAYH
jgi:hypothetical protein